ncbi:MAG: 3-oxoacyl-ACP reductase FabG [Actinomycetota bacterium]|nr:3-oxoacyl-ACP reductase FabG [Actinomycetota bacterium]
MGNMQGQVALVTGGSRGIGAAIVKALAGRGATVAAGYSRNSDAAERLQKALPEGQVSIHQGNIGEPEDAQRVVDEVLGQHGRLDVLVNNAGINEDKTIRKMTPEDWDKVIKINLNGAFYLSSKVLPHMLERGSGRIVNISSVIGEMGNVGQANYAASKAGLHGLTKTMALETAAKGITVNAVTPGFIATDMVTSMPDEALEKVVKLIPIGRLGEPEEVARVVEFLADPDAGYLTGTVVAINGGLHM